MQKFLMHILFGTDIDSTRLIVNQRPHVGVPFTEKECSLSEAMEETFNQIFDTIALRLPNPLWNFLYKTTGKCFSFTEKERVADQNCSTVREAIRKYIRQRVSGEATSDVDNESDVLSLMLKNSDVFTEDDIIDELLDFAVAGTMTTQLTIQNTLAYLMTEPQSMARVRAEFDQVLGEDGLADIENVFNKSLTIESC